MYNIGDRVAIRPDLEEFGVYGGVGVAPEMVEMGGEEFTIFTIDEFDNGSIRIYSTKENQWSWTDEMLLPVIKEQPLDLADSDIGFLLED